MAPTSPLDSPYTSWGGPVGHAECYSTSIAFLADGALWLETEEGPRSTHAGILRLIGVTVPPKW